jgi:hypothetical protein
MKKFNMEKVMTGYKFVVKLVWYVAVTYYVSKKISEAISKISIRLVDKVLNTETVHTSSIEDEYYIDTYSNDED